MKPESEDTKAIELAIRSALRGLDDSIKPSRFQDDWLAAKEQGQAAELINKPRPVQEGFRPLSTFHQWRPLVALGSLILVGVLVMINVEKSIPPEPVSLVEESVPVFTVDPNQAWSSPTDELLSVGVRRYETQYLRFASYNPITMEINQ